MAPAELRGRSVLVVDDEPANLELLREFLADDGFQAVTLEGDSARAAARFHELRPDLLLLDLHMPPPDGFAVMREVRASIPAGEYVPILVLTADATTETRLRALASGASDFLAKPLDGVEVMLRIRNLLQTRSLYLRERQAREAAEAGRRRAAFLAEASRVLALSFDTRSMLATVARLAVREVADFCVVDLAAEGGAEDAGREGAGPERAAFAHADPALEALLADADGPWGGALPADHPGVRQLTAGQFVLIGDLAAELAGAPAWRDDGRLRRLAPRSVASVPLVSGGRVRGGLTLGTAGSGRVLDRDDLALAEELARRVSAALDAAQLYGDALRATRARDEVLGVVAHDLRNPLNTIRMAGQLLRDDAPAPLRRPAETVLRVADRMDALIQDLLEVTRIESGRLPLDRRPERPHVLLAEAAAMLGPLAAARGVALECGAADGLQAVQMDAARVLQVISNLVGNAIKFTPDGGRITVSCSAEADGGLRFAVADTGPGIPPEQMPRVFGRFWQARDSDRRGIGLGLSIARGIVEAHGGRIWVESAVGQGSTFWFTLAGTPAPDVRRADPPAPPPAPREMAPAAGA